MEQTKKKKGKKIALIILLVLLGIIIAVVSAFFIMRAVGKHQFHKQDTGIDKQSISQNVDIEINENEIEYNEKSYVLDPDVVSILFMGVDKKSINADLGYGKNGQADSIFVAAINTREKTIKLIPISRETMVDVNIYSKDGEYAGIKHEQLCLAYAYGDTPENCSKNVMESVRRALYGINISSYVAVDLDGLEAITDAVGGVDVACLEDIKIDNRTYRQGENMHLTGYLARNYIQKRDKSDINGNTKRMLRQKQFLSAFANKAGNQIMDNFSKLGSYYSMMKPYFSSNLSLSQLTYLASSCLTLNVGDSFDYKTITGETVTDGEHIQFIPDEKSTLDAVIDTFYMEK